VGSGGSGGPPRSVVLLGPPVYGGLEVLWLPLSEVWQIAATVPKGPVAVSILPSTRRFKSGPTMGCIVPYGPTSYAFQRQARSDLPFTEPREPVLACSSPQRRLYPQAARELWAVCSLWGCGGATDPDFPWMCCSKVNGSLGVGCTVHRAHFGIMVSRVSLTALIHLVI
jgi:hypothetical protein